MSSTNAIGDQIKDKITKVTKVLQKSIKALYSIVSVISTLTIFSALIIFLIGKTRAGKICDDDLTMQRIKSQMPDNLTISDIHIDDIHGLGSDSMIVFAVDKNENQIANQLLIFDKVENDILNQFNNLFGYGSNYKLSYMFSLEETNLEFGDRYYYPNSLEIIDTVDLTGDLSKEIIVKFVPLPTGNGGVYYVGIFSYSYETHTYKLIGTFPEAKLYDNKGIYYASTVFHEDNCEFGNYYNKDERFQLADGDKFYNDFFIEEEYEKTLLVRADAIWGEEGYHDPHWYTISVFKAAYDAETGELTWKVISSKETDEYIGYCTQEYAKEFLEKETSLKVELR